MNRIAKIIIGHCTMAGRSIVRRHKPDGCRKLLVRTCLDLDTGLSYSARRSRRRRLI